MHDLNPFEGFEIERIATKPTNPYHTPTRKLRSTDFEIEGFEDLFRHFFEIPQELLACIEELREINNQNRNWMNDIKHQVTGLAQNGLPLDDSQEFTSLQYQPGFPKFRESNELIDFNNFQTQFRIQSAQFKETNLSLTRIQTEMISLKNEMKFYSNLMLFISLIGIIGMIILVITQILAK